MCASVVWACASALPYLQALGHRERLHCNVRMSNARGQLRPLSYPTTRRSAVQLPVCMGLMHVSPQDIVTAQPDAAEPYAAPITTAAVAIFPAVANDVQLMDALSELLASLARAPRCLPHMAPAGMPVLLATLQDGASSQAAEPSVQLPGQSSVLLEGTLDLIASFATDADVGAHPCMRSRPHAFCVSRRDAWREVLLMRGRARVGSAMIWYVETD